MPFVLEPHVATALDTPEGIRAIVDEVGSPFVRVNIDPVNLVGDLPTLWAPRPTRSAASRPWRTSPSAAT